MDSNIKFAIAAFTVISVVAICRAERRDVPSVAKSLGLAPFAVALLKLR
ncbi:hypothetical protein ACFWFI_05475 [Streptomyces sp. NPDC060209]